MSRTHLVTFSDESMSRAAELCVTSAARNGVDDSLRWEHEMLRHTVFYHENKWMRETVRGLGFWAWKPWIIHKLFDFHLTGDQFIRNSITPVRDGDIVIYADAGVEFINNVNYIIDRMDQDIFLFGNNWEHAHWCKSDIVEMIWPYLPTFNERWSYSCMRDSWARFGKQAQASVIFFKVNDWTRAFVSEWLKWCLFEGGRLIDDSPSTHYDHPEFRENRHDQAILTTMAYREGLRLHAWPAVYNRFLGQEFVYSREGYPASDDFPSLFHHHRLRNSEFDALGIKV